MKRFPPRASSALALIAALTFGALPARAQTLYVNPNMYSSMYAVNAAQLAQNLQFAAQIKHWGNVQATLESASRKPQAPDAAHDRLSSAPVTSLTATDFKPTGRRDAPQRLAAQIKDPALRPQIQKLARDLMAAIEAQPDFRRNNLAYALTVYLGGSLQVLSGQSIDDERSKALAQWINDEMVAAGVVARLDAAARTQLYDVLLLQGGLIIGIAQAGADNQDEEQIATAKTMARDALATFGITLPPEGAPPPG